MNEATMMERALLLDVLEQIAAKRRIANIAAGVDLGRVYAWRWRAFMPHGAPTQPTMAQEAS